MKKWKELDYRQKSIVKSIIWCVLSLIITCVLILLWNWDNIGVFGTIFVIPIAMYSTFESAHHIFWCIEHPWNNGDEEISNKEELMAE